MRDLNINKTLIIRADGGPQIGIGHISRCLYFVQNIKEKIEIVFCIKRNSKIREFLTSQNYIVNELNASISIQEELTYLLDISSDLLILDLQNKPDLYYQTFSDKFNKVLRMDDSNSNINIFSDFYLNCNLYSENINFKIKNKDCELFLGPNYYILNPIFKKYENFQRSFNSKANNILLAMGGGDPKNLTIKIAKALMKIEDIKLNIILGKLFERFHEIEKLKIQYPEKISIFKNINNMPDMMATNDLIIAAGGNISYEAAFMGLPGLLIPQIDLQELNASIFEEKRVFKNGGLGENISKEQIKDFVYNLIIDEKTREEFSKNGKNLIRADCIDNVIKKFIN